MALGEVYMLLYFAPCRPLARPHRRPRQNPPCLQCSGLVLFLFYVHDGFPNSKVRALADLCAHSTPPPPPPPPRLLVADADEAVTYAFFFHPFCLLSFCPRPFQIQGAEFFTLFCLLLPFCPRPFQVQGAERRAKSSRLA